MSEVPGTLRILDAKDLRNDDLQAKNAAQAERIKALEEGLEAIERNADRRYKDLTHDDLHGFADIHCRYRDAARALLEKP